MLQIIGTLGNVSPRFKMLSLYLQFSEILQIWLLRAMSKNSWLTVVKRKLRSFNASRFCNCEIRDHLSGYGRIERSWDQSSARLRQCLRTIKPFIRLYARLISFRFTVKQNLKKWTVICLSVTHVFLKNGCTNYYEIQ